MSILGIAWRVVLVIVTGYLLGGVPFGVIVTRRMSGVDLTEVGSGSTGATNVYRAAGWRAALVVAVLDIAKGAVPALLARLIADPTWAVNGRDLFVLTAGVAAMAGHMFSPYFRLRGGKGVATAAGAVLVLMPKMFPVLVVVFVLGIIIFRIVSVASIVAAVIFPAATYLLYPDRPVLLVFTAIAFVLVVWSHRANITRLLHGEEPRITMGRGRIGKGGGDS